MQTAIKQYIEGAPEDRRPELRWLHTQITKRWPRATEEIRHGMPHHLLDGEVLLAYAARAKHCMVYFCEQELPDDLIERFGNLKSGKSCIRFAVNRTHPLEELHALYSEAFAHLQKTRQ